MADAFKDITGQTDVVEFLRNSIDSGRVGQSYLFVGPAGSFKTETAYAFSKALLCPNGGKADGVPGACTCEVCTKIDRRQHPDVRYFAPEGANAYLVSQIRDLIADVDMAPIQGDKKIYIIDRVDQMGTSAANAFLKTLEEPPEHVVLILLGRTADGVLPTVLSRCQVVPFRHIPASEAVRIIMSRKDVSEKMALIALESAGGSVTKAIELLKSGVSRNERLEFREAVLEKLSSLQLADDWDIIEYASELVEKMDLPLDAVRRELEQELEENREFFSKSAIRQIEERNKRRLTAKTRELLAQMTAIIRSWLRDVMMVCAHTPEFVVNVDVMAGIERAAGATTEARAAAALSCADACSEAISYNVSPETCLDALLFEVKEVLYGTGRTHNHRI